MHLSLYLNNQGNHFFLLYPLHLTVSIICMSYFHLLCLIYLSSLQSIFTILYPFYKVCNFVLTDIFFFILLFLMNLVYSVGKNSTINPLTDLSLRTIFISFWIMCFLFPIPVTTTLAREPLLWSYQHFLVHHNE